MSTISTQENNKVVIYARFSSTHQREESIDAQIRACKEYSERNGYVVIDTYCDSAKSGTNSDREAFQKMIKDSKEREFNYVIVHKLDRFSRDKYDSVMYKRELRNNDVRVISVTENLSDTPEAMILESVLEGMAQYYSANLASEVMKGMKENAFSCKHNGGIAPLGYDVNPDDLTYLINEEEAEIVRKIFTMYSNCCGYAEMLEQLNVLGYRTKTGNKFSKSSIQTIIKNEKYRGVYIFNRKKKLDNNRKRRATEKPQEEVIRVEDGMPRIVSDDMFYKANHQMTKNKLRGGTHNAKDYYLLSGVIYCAKCGSAMCGNGRKGGNSSKKYYSYRCGSKTNKKANFCDCKEVRREFVENYVLDELNELLFNEDTLRELVVKMNVYSEEKTKSTKCELKLVKKKLKSLEKELGKTLKLVTDGNVSFETIKGSVVKLEDEKQYLENEVLELENNLRADNVTIEKLEKLIEESKSYVLAKNIPECRRFVESYIDNVIVSSEGVKVIYNIIKVDTKTNELVKYETSIAKEDLYQQYKYVLNQSA